MEAHVELEILTYWQAGSAYGGGLGADTLAHRDATGLPFLPGRTVKGLLRESCELGEAAGMIPSGKAVEWFGSPPVANAGRKDDREHELEAARFVTEPGVLVFDSARMSEPWTRWASQASSSDRENLFAVLSSTRIEDGLAKDASLRSDEVAVPMTLTARIHGPDGEWPRQLDECARMFLRSLGRRRNRGFGRVSVRVVG
ncbi:MAG: hypothetical protein HYV07_13260 [Deltaproteobacteria bacterium]|nr:hypothetical protein [Deltaproteobacteria bacterium]